MGRNLSLDDLDHYSNGGSGGSYFQLKKDKETARVRILLNKFEDIENFMFACHKVDVPGTKYGRQVACLRAYNEPVEKCPFCADGKKPQPKIFIPLYNEDAEEVQVFERGKGYMSKLRGFLSRYNKPTVVAHSVDIERCGKEGDTNTTYELYDNGADDTKLSDLPEPPTILGRYILDKTEDDMNYYLEEGEFPPEDDEDEKPRRRGGRNDKEDVEEDDVPFEEPKRRGRRQEEDEPRRARTDREGNRRTPNGNNGGRRRSF